MLEGTNRVRMSRNGRVIAVVVAAVMVGAMGGLAAPMAGAQAKTCQSPAGTYDVTPPLAGSPEGADPAEVAAANCTLGFREDSTYPLSVIGLALLATLGTLLLLRRGDAYEAIGSEA